MNNLTLKKQLLAGALALALLSSASAQTASFLFDNGTGTPTAGTYTPGSSFTFAVDLAFTPGGTITNLEGLSYWLQQKTPSGAPFNFAITLRDPTTSVGAGPAGPSPFTDLQTPGLTYPQNLNPSNANDLGGALPSSPGPGSTPLGAGTYFVADITISIAANAPDAGTFVLSDVLTGGKTSVIANSTGQTFAIAEEDYTITLVPEPATWVGAGLVATLLAWSAIRRRTSRQTLGS